MLDEKGVRNELVSFLTNAFTHKSLFDAVEDFPEDQMNSKPDHVPYTFWHLLEHIRFAQRDMIEFIQNPNYQEPEWPKEYWPTRDKKATKEMWDKTIQQIRKDIDTLVDIIKDPANDLLKPIPNGTGQTLFKEILQVIDHAGYHTGEFILMRRAMNNWTVKEAVS